MKIWYLTLSVKSQRECPLTSLVSILPKLNLLSQVYQSRLRKSPKTPLITYPLATSSTLTCMKPWRYFDVHFSFSNCTSNLSRTCLIHIHDFPNILFILNFKTTSNITNSIVHIKLDHCSSLFLKTESTKIKHFQLIQIHLLMLLLGELSTIKSPLSLSHCTG